MVKPVSLGANSSGYPLYEIETINAARISGKDQNEIKKLVTTLMENRINII